MAFEIIRWITLVILWGCIGLNWWCILRSCRNSKETDKIRANLERGIAEVEALREKWLERLKLLEVIPDEGADNDNC